MKMKRQLTILYAIIAGLFALSCNERYDAITASVFTADRVEISGVDYLDPAAEVVNVSTDAPFWIARCSDWITIDRDNAPGGQTAVTLNFTSNYKNEKVSVLPRSGEVVFSGGGKKLVITVNQLGYEAPVDPSDHIGGIPDADELLKFATAVNEGTDLGRWKSDDGEITLLADIDLTGQEWIPIGNARIGRDGVLVKDDVQPFSGVFNGGNHKISGLSYHPDGMNLGTGSVLGFFGALSGATVYDLTVEVAMVSVESPAVQMSVGGLAGAICNSSVLKNCKVLAANVNSRISAEQTVTGTVPLYIGGLAGLVHASSIEECENNCPVRVKNILNSNNGANTYAVGGIYGFSQGTVSVKSCVNNAELGGKIGGENWGDGGRMGGIIGTANSAVTIEGCVNNGNIKCTCTTTSDKSSRSAGILAYAGAANTVLKNSVNNGDVCFICADATGSQYGGYVAGFIGQTAKPVDIIGCENYGSILSDRWFYKEFVPGEGEYPSMGIGMARPNKQASQMTGCKIGGKIGPYSDPSKVVTLSATDFELYILGDTFAARKVVVCNGNTFASK